MKPRRLIALLSTALLVLVGVWGGTSAAQAWANLSITSDTSFVLKNSPTPPMVISVASFTPGPGNTGFSTISLDFRWAGGGNYWAWKNTCTGTGLTMADCGISSVVIGGVTTTPQSVELANGREALMTFAQSYTATTTVVINLAAGALTTPSTIGGYVADVYFGPYSATMTDSGMTGTIAVGSAVTFHPGAATGADTTQLGAWNTQLNTNPYTRNGYTFAGWATSNGSNTVAYNNSDYYNFANDMDLYAVWTPVAVSSSPTASATPTPSATTEATNTLAVTGFTPLLPLGIAAVLTVTGAILIPLRRKFTQ